MNHRNRRLRSMDPLLILTLIVVIGVVLTTTVQARSPEDIPEPLLLDLPEERPESWLSRIMKDVGSLVSSSEETYMSPTGNGTRRDEGLSWHVKAAHSAAASANTLEPEVRFGVSYRW